MNSVVRQYFKEISRTLPCPKSVRSVMIQEFKDDVLEFAENNAAVTLSELYHEFGLPHVIANGFLNRKDYEELLEQSKKKAFVLRCAGIVLLILLIIAVVLTMFLYKHVGGAVTISDIY